MRGLGERIVAFKQIDVDGEGSIDFAELLVWWRKQKAKDLKKFDESKLQAGESGAEGGEGKGGEPDEAEARLKTIWNIVDTDASGSLDEAEVRRVFMSMGEKWASDDKPSAAKKFAKAFKAMDSDGGGEISFEELLAWWRKQKGKAKAAFDGISQSNPLFGAALAQGPGPLRAEWALAGTQCGCFTRCNTTRG